MCCSVLQCKQHMQYTPHLQPNHLPLSLSLSRSLFLSLSLSLFLSPFLSLPPSLSVSLSLSLILIGKQHMLQASTLQPKPLTLAHTHAHTFAHTHAYAHTHTHVLIGEQCMLQTSKPNYHGTRTHMYTHARTHTRTHACTHARTHTRTHEEDLLNAVYCTVYDSADCKNLGVMDNMCGKCTALQGGGFQLEETTAGLRSVCRERERGEELRSMCVCVYLFKYLRVCWCPGPDFPSPLTCVCVCVCVCECLWCVRPNCFHYSMCGGMWVCGYACNIKLCCSLLQKPPDNL